MCMHASVHADYFAAELMKFIVIIYEWKGDVVSGRVLWVGKMTDFEAF